MRKLEIVLAVLALLGIALRFNQIQGSNALLLYSTIILSILYFPLGFILLNAIPLNKIFRKEAYQNTSPSKIVLSIVAGFGSANICVGIVFKFLQLTGAGQMLFFGVIISFITLIISLIGWLRKKDRSSFPVLTRTIIIGGIGLVLFFTPYLSIVKLQYRNYPAYIQAYEAYMNDEGRDDLRKEMDLEYNRIILSPEEFEEYQRYNAN